MPISIGEFAAIGIGLGNIAAWSKLIYDARKNGKNGKDGNGRSCSFHTGVESRLMKVETEREGLSQELGVLHTENRQEHSQIFGEIKSLAVAVSTASEAARTAASAAATAASAAAASAETMRRKK